MFASWVKMFVKETCAIAKDGNKWEFSNSVANFIKKVRDEDRRVNELRNQELLATAENPRIKRQEETTEICQELRDIKRNEMLQERRRKQLQSNSHELRLLQGQIRSAKVSQELIGQKERLEKLKKEEMRKKREENDKWAEKCEQERRLGIKEAEEQRQYRVEFMSGLKGQIAEQHQRRLKEYEVILKDREEIQNRLRQIKNEEKAEREAALRYRDKCKVEMDECMRNKILQKQLEKQTSKDDLSKFLAYSDEREALKKRIEGERKRLQEERQSLSERIGAQIERIENERQHREEVLLSLLIEERKAKEDARFRHNLEKTNGERLRLRSELENYRDSVKPDTDAQRKEEERLLHEERMRVQRKNDELVRLADERRRKEIMEHTKSLRTIIDIRRRERVEEAIEKLRESERLFGLQKDMDKEIEEERLRLLRSQPPELLRYLPTGVIRPSDRELLNLPGRNDS
uniref:Meiosis-specific nuclear structural protein 1 n=1 Tax=Glossina palpalis gambiensis TaxID=67801 RepID=A0A1B0BHN9_9MUSC